MEPAAFPHRYNGVPCLATRCLITTVSSKRPIPSVELFLTDTSRLYLEEDAGICFMVSGQSPAPKVHEIIPDRIVSYMN